MLEGIPFGLETLTPSVLLGLVILLILTGRLIPSKTVAETKAATDARLAEAHAETAYWRTAYETSQVASGINVENMNTLLESSRTMEAVLRSLQRAAGLEVGQ